MAKTKEERKAQSLEIQKASGYAAQKKYKQKIGKCYVYLKQESKEKLDAIANKQNISLSSLFLDAVEKTYNIKLR